MGVMDRERPGGRCRHERERDTPTCQDRLGRPPVPDAAAVDRSRRTHRDAAAASSTVEGTVDGQPDRTTKLKALPPDRYDPLVEGSSPVALLLLGAPGVDCSPGLTPPVVWL